MCEFCKCKANLKTQNEGIAECMFSTKILTFFITSTTLKKWKLEVRDRIYDYIV